MVYKSPALLTAREKQILDFILQYIKKWGYSPSLKEIAKAIDLKSTSGLIPYIRILKKKGYLLEKEEKAYRNLVVNEKHLKELLPELRLPVLGFISAGKPLEPYTDPNATIDIPPSMVSGKRRSFVLQVKGDSMIEEGILDGDFVIIEEQAEANNGDIVVALLENGLATLKRFYKEKTRVRLEPANSKMAPIFAKNVQIQGKVVGLIRRYSR
ncbi:MAG: transcriptional repressor LexA [Microgenomates group bacterium]